MNTLTWWGYIHIDGSIVVKRFLDQVDLDDAAKSEFVKTIFQPFVAVNREAAVRKCHAKHNEPKEDDSRYE
jgi:hypothetical protein